MNYVQYCLLVGCFFVIVGAMPFGEDAPVYPARGWSSYDAYDLGITEDRLFDQVTALKPLRSTGEFRYMLLDEGWAATIRANSKDWWLDENCRPRPNPDTFPSTKGTRSFANISMKLRQEGFSLALWHIKGIPKKAVDNNCKILGTNYRARDIADLRQTCVWHESRSNVRDMYLLKPGHPGALAYYESIAQLFKEWGVEYTKIDCIFGQRDWDEDALTTYSKALSTVFPARKMVFSTSPGVRTALHHAEFGAKLVSSYRITDDLWDSWGPSQAGPSGITVHSCTVALVQFAKIQGRKIGFGGLPAYADADMLPFGNIGLGGTRISRIPARETRYVYGLWSIAQSPIILGGDLTLMANPSHQWLYSLLNNTWLATLGKTSVEPRVLDFKGPQRDAPGVSVWISRHRGNNKAKIEYFKRKKGSSEEITPMTPATRNTRYLGIFPYAFSLDSRGSVSVRVEISNFGLEVHESLSQFQLELLDLFSFRYIAPVSLASQSFSVKCPVNDACLYRVDIVHVGNHDDDFLAHEQNEGKDAQSTNVDAILPSLMPHIEKTNELSSAKEEPMHTIASKKRKRGRKIVSSDSSLDGGVPNVAHVHQVDNAQEISTLPSVVVFLIFVVGAMIAFLARRRRGFKK